MEAELKCAVLECGRRIGPGETYYALGGLGRVTTCEWRATQRALRYKVGEVWLVEPRGWDRTACARNVRRQAPPEAL